MGSIDAYGRVYKNKINSGFVLESYISNGEYKDVLGTDTSRFFFVVDERKSFGEDPSSEIDIVFMVDLNDFYNSNERMDEEFKSVVNQVLRDSLMTVNNFYGYERLNTMLSGFQLGKSMDFDHMHPKLIFTVNGTVNYNLKACI